MLDVYKCLELEHVDIVHISTMPIGLYILSSSIVTISRSKANCMVLIRCEPLDPISPIKALPCFSPHNNTKPKS